MKRLISVCSALLLSVCAVLGSDLSDFRANVDAAKSIEELQSAIDRAPESVRHDKSYEPYFSQSVDETLAEYYEEYTWIDIQQWILENVDAKIAKESGETGGEVEDPRKTANDILSNPIYVDPKQTEDRNWIGDAGARLSQSFFDWLAGLFPEPDINASGVPVSLLGGIQYFMWAILILLVGLALFFILRNFAGLGRKKRVGGILEDDEPDRTADQWLEQAEKLESEGKLREAVRCLYLACLVRFDDGGVARFRRHETNWEHLYRIEASPETPRDIDFRHTTQRFDKIWYGHMIEGVGDVHEFKEVYKRICIALGIKKAA